MILLNKINTIDRNNQNYYLNEKIAQENIFRLELEAKKLGFIVEEL